MRNSLRYIFPLVAAVFLLSGCTESASVDESATQTAEGQGTGNSFQSILEKGVLRVGTTGDFFMSFIDTDSGKRMGYDIDLTTQLAADMGVEIEYVATDWAGLVSGLAAGRYDITTGASFNPGRARTASYTEPVARVGTVAVIKKTDAARFTGWDRINQPNVRVAVRQGSVFEDQANAITPDASINAVASPATEYQEVLAGRADVAITSLFDAASLVSSQAALQIAPVEPRNTNYIGLLVRQDEHELRNFIDSWIRAKRYSGFIDDLTVKWNLAF